MAWASLSSPASRSPSRRRQGIGHPGVHRARDLVPRRRRSTREGIPRLARRRNVADLARRRMVSVDPHAGVLINTLVSTVMFAGGLRFSVSGPCSDQQGGGNQRERGDEQ